MTLTSLRVVARAAAALTLSAALTSSLTAQTRRILPVGSVILVRTEQPLTSSTARVGQTFETTVIDTVRVDSYTVIPAGTHIRGVVSFVQPTTRQASGVIQVAFDRMTLLDGTAYPLTGRLTSTDATERQQIDADPNSRVVLVGARGGIGAAIAGAGSASSSSNNILSALGSMLSEGGDVQLAAGTTLAVQLQQQLALRTRGGMRAGDVNTVYTETDRVRAAQQVLASQNYYHGAINGQLNVATQRALFQYQVDKSIIATGNLDGRTAQSLGVLAATSADVAGNTVVTGTLTPDQAGSVRRNAQSLVLRERQDLAIATTGRLSTARTYADGDLDLWFAISAFADNAALYEQVVRLSGVGAGPSAGRALLSAARRVEAAMPQSSASSTVQSAWTTIRQQLVQISPN